MDFKEIAAKKGPTPYRGLLWAAVFALGLMALTLYFRQESARRPEPAKAASLAPSTAPAGAEDKRALIEAAYEEEVKPEPKPLPNYLTDASMMKEGLDSSALNTYGFYYLLYQMSITDPATLAGKAAPLPGTEGVGALEPGTPLSLAGQVLTIEERKDLTIPEVKIESATQYEIKDAAGRVVLVYAVHKMLGVEEGDHAKVLGRFLRLYPHLRSDSAKDDKPQPTPVVVTREVDGSQLVTDAASLAEVNDSTPAHEPKPFYHLVNLVRGLTQEQLKARVDKTLTPSVLLKSPAAARGRFVVIDGAVLVAQRQEKPPNIAGVKNLYWSILLTADTKPVWVFTLEEPKGFARHDNVRVYGAFFKSRPYLTREGFERTTLVVVARRLVPVKFSSPPYLVIIVLVIGAVTLIGLLIGTRAERRGSSETSQRVRALSARARPKNLNETARSIASLARKTKQAGDQPPPQPPEQ